MHIRGVRRINKNVLRSRRWTGFLGDASATVTVARDALDFFTRLLALPCVYWRVSLQRTHKTDLVRVCTEIRIALYQFSDCFHPTTREHFVSVRAHRTVHARLFPDEAAARSSYFLFLYGDIKRRAILWRLFAIDVAREYNVSHKWICRSPRAFALADNRCCWNHILYWKRGERDPDKGSQVFFRVV